MSALNLIGGLVHDCHSAQPFLDKSPALFELLADHLGWPSDVYVTRVNAGTLPLFIDVLFLAALDGSSLQTRK